MPECEGTEFVPRTEAAAKKKEKKMEWEYEKKRYNAKPRNRIYEYMKFIRIIMKIDDLNGVQRKYKYYAKIIHMQTHTHTCLRIL